MDSMWDLNIRPGADCEWRWVVCPPPAATYIERYDCCVPEIHVGHMMWPNCTSGKTLLYWASTL